MTTRERNDSGRYVETLTLETVREAVANAPDPIATTKEVADALGCSREAARLKLVELHGEGRIERRNVGAKAIVWWVPPGDPGDETIDTRLKRLSNELGEPITVGSAVYEDGDRHALNETDTSQGIDHPPETAIDAKAPDVRSGPSDVSDNLEAAISDLGLDTERRDAVRAMYAYLAEHGTARKADFTGEVYPEHSAGYGSPGGWWNRLGKEALASLPDVSKPAEGRPTWRFSGE